MARTATDYSAMIKRKEEEIAKLTSDCEASKSERHSLLKEITKLESKIDTLSSELHASQDDRTRSSEARSRLQEELDELRALVQAKVTEETRRSEVDKSKEVELVDLRVQVNRLSQDLSEARKQAVEGQSKLKVDLDTLTRDYRSLEQSHKSLSDRGNVAQSQLMKAEAALADAEKSRRTIESDLQSLRSRQIDLDGQLATAVKEKEVGVFPLFRHAVV